MGGSRLNSPSQKSQSPPKRAYLFGALFLLAIQSLWTSLAFDKQSLWTSFAHDVRLDLEGLHTQPTTSPFLTTNGDSQALEKLKKRIEDLEAKLSNHISDSKSIDAVAGSSSFLATPSESTTADTNVMQVDISAEHPFGAETMRPYNPSRYDAQRQEVDAEDPIERCKRYGFDYNPAIRSIENPRRVFFGSLIADDPMDVLEAHATEMYDMYHAVVLVESNLTQSKIRRQTRYHSGSHRLKTIQNHFFGKDTKVDVVQLQETNETIEIGALQREWLQREPIISEWAKLGMRPDDLGISSDADEFFSRDFLRALQTCDLPEFRPGQDCHEPKIQGSGMVFEGYPDCVSQDRLWWRPDLMIGECLEGIGDPTGRLVPTRPLPGNLGRRSGHWKAEMNLTKHTGLYPLWSTLSMLPSSCLVIICTCTLMRTFRLVSIDSFQRTSNDGWRQATGNEGKRWHVQRDPSGTNSPRQCFPPTQLLPGFGDIATQVPDLWAQEQESLQNRLGKTWK